MITISIVLVISLLVSIMFLTYLTIKDRTQQDIKAKDKLLYTRAEDNLVYTKTGDFYVNGKKIKAGDTEFIMPEEYTIDMMMTPCKNIIQDPIDLSTGNWETVNCKPDEILKEGYEHICVTVFDGLHKVLSPKCTIEYKNKQLLINGFDIKIREKIFKDYILPAKFIFSAILNTNITNDVYLGNIGVYEV